MATVIIKKNFADGLSDLAGDRGDGNHLRAQQVMLANLYNDLVAQIAANASYEDFQTDMVAATVAARVGAIEVE